MITETKTERGRTVLTVETQQEFDQAFGRMLEDHSIDIEAPPSCLKRMGSSIRPKNTACWMRPTEASPAAGPTCAPVETGALTGRPTPQQPGLRPESH